MQHGREICGTASRPAEHTVLRVSISECRYWIFWISRYRSWTGYSETQQVLFLPAIQHARNLRGLYFKNPNIHRQGRRLLCPDPETGHWPRNQICASRKRDLGNTVKKGTREHDFSVEPCGGPHPQLIEYEVRDNEGGGRPGGTHSTRIGKPSAQRGGIDEDFGISGKIGCYCCLGGKLRSQGKFCGYDSGYIAEYGSFINKQRRQSLMV